ncbi:MAG: type II toxin-antitoxin system prevent-host-death family antitoxin [Actinomycetes bacterium]
MGTVPIRELRNNGGAVADRVLAGEQVIVTHAGKPIMELVPVPRPPLSAEALLARWRNLEPIDGAQLRHDLAAVLDESV